MTGLPSASQTVAPATGPQYERIAGLYAETLKGREIMYCHEAIFDLGACGGYLRMEIHLLPHQDPPEVDSMITSLLVQEGHYNWLVGAVKKLAHCFVMPISKNQIRQVVKTVEMGAECLLAVNDHLPRLATSYERFSQFGERVHARLTEFDALVSHALRISEYASHLPNPHVLLDVDGNQWIKLAGRFGTPLGTVGELKAAELNDTCQELLGASYHLGYAAGIFEIEKSLADKFPQYREICDIVRYIQDLETVIKQLKESMPRLIGDLLLPDHKSVCTLVPIMIKALTKPAEFWVPSMTPSSQVKESFEKIKLKLKAVMKPSEDHVQASG